MKHDLTLKLTPELLRNNTLYGHLGTHFDVMNREFPLGYTETEGIFFDVSAITERDIEPGDLNTEAIRSGMTVLFHTGFLAKYGYGSDIYRHQHPQLSPQLIELLTEKKIAIIGVDCAGIRRGREHTPADQYCADRGVFVVENLYNLDQLNNEERFIVHTYPLNASGLTGLPCRVIAETISQLE